MSPTDEVARILKSMPLGALIVWSPERATLVPFTQLARAWALLTRGGRVVGMIHGHWRAPTQVTTWSDARPAVRAYVVRVATAARDGQLELDTDGVAELALALPAADVDYD